MRMGYRTQTDPRRGATFTYVEGTTGNRPTWKSTLPYGPVIAAIPKQHHAMAINLVRLVREAAERNRNPPVPFYRHTTRCLKEIEEIIIAAHTSISVHLVPPNYRRFADNIKNMMDRPDSAAITGYVGDAMRLAYDLGADEDKLVAAFALIYGD